MDDKFLIEHRALIKKHYPDYRYSEIKVVAPHFNFEVKEMYSDKEMENGRQPIRRPADRGNTV